MYVALILKRTAANELYRDLAPKPPGLHPLPGGSLADTWIKDKRKKKRGISEGELTKSQKETIHTCMVRRLPLPPALDPDNPETKKKLEDRAGRSWISPTMRRHLRVIGQIGRMIVTGYIQRQPTVLLVWGFCACIVAHFIMWATQTLPAETHNPGKPRP